MIHFIFLNIVYIRSNVTILNKIILLDTKHEDEE